jgi:hypothetical protein
MYSMVLNGHSVAGDGFKDLSNKYDTLKNCPHYNI